MRKLAAWKTPECERPISLQYRSSRPPVLASSIVDGNMVMPVTNQMLHQEHEYEICKPLLTLIVASSQLDALTAL